MIKEFIESRMEACGMTTVELAKKSGLRAEDLGQLLAELNAPFKIEQMLKVFGAEISVSIAGRAWKADSARELSVNENLLRLFTAQRPQVSLSPIWFFLQYFDGSNTKLTKDLLVKCIEYHEPRITVTGVDIGEENDGWTITVHYFDHSGRTRSNAVFPFIPVLEMSNLPEVQRRSAMDIFIAESEFDSALIAIDSARRLLEFTSSSTDAINLAIQNLELIDVSILDNSSWQLCLDTLAKLRLLKEQKL
ncbi:hypothetical protein WG904_14405 [Pedobacter sp. Du54]|uniref:hypothetical protein n=1 Tax=Pedobacter anseongensis TaxID=3133439 RepID=UPI0030B66025